MNWKWVTSDIRRDVAILLPWNSFKGHWHKFPWTPENSTSQVCVTKLQSLLGFLLSPQLSSFYLTYSITTSGMAKTKACMGYLKEDGTVAASPHLPLPSKLSCKVMSHPFSALSGQMICEASIPTWGAEGAQPLWSDTNFCATVGTSTRRTCHL